MIWHGGLIRCAGVAAAVVVTACSGPTYSHVSPAVVDHFKGIPRGVSVPDGHQKARTPKPLAAWAGPRSIYVMTWGSSSCPRIPSSANASGPDRVVIKTVEHDFHRGDNTCTADLGPTTSVVRLPSSIDATRALAVQIDGTSRQLAARSN